MNLNQYSAFLVLFTTQIHLLPVNVADFTSNTWRRHDAARVMDFPSAAAFRGPGAAAAALRPHLIRTTSWCRWPWPLSVSCRRLLFTMASSDGLEEDCVLQRGRSQSDPSSITEVRLGEAHRAGKRRGGGNPTACWTCVSCLIYCCFTRSTG